MWPRPDPATLVNFLTRPAPQKGAWAPPPIFGPCLLWPNDCMDYDDTWYGGRPRPKRLCVRWEPSSPSQKGGFRPLPIFGPCLLWPRSRISATAELVSFYYRETQKTIVYCRGKSQSISEVSVAMRLTTRPIGIFMVALRNRAGHYIFAL